MRRHSIAIRLGPDDTETLNMIEPESACTEIRFIDDQGKIGFGIGQMIDGLLARSVYPTETALDLILLASAVTAADTRISRSTESQDSWTREVDLYMPVQDLDKWQLTGKLVNRILNFLTGDKWRVIFRSRNEEYSELIAQSDEPITPDFDSVSLFSGGLDSFIGAIDLIEQDNHPIFVSHYWDISTSSQVACAEHLGEVYGSFEPRHVRARIGFPDNLIEGSAPEMTSRGRSFLFFAMAALTASGLGENCNIFVPENGLISLNVPMDPLRVGAWSTRTTHPFYMARWSELTNLIGLSVNWSNPYRFRTKGEMVEECTNPDILRLHVGETISCSSVAKARWKGLPPGHCGHCVPCIIRKAAIRKGLGTDPTTYTIGDFADRSLNSKLAEGSNVRSFQMISRRLTQNPELAHILIHKTGPLSDYSKDDIDQYANVFTRGIEEVSVIVDDARVRPS
ncbi:MAG: hypothetical protein HN401_00335 [Euryarchaeota archaeon]|jgi:hypothetical protein|nr:hypothetical protein [Euryarchaeota archaeon]